MNDDLRQLLEAWATPEEYVEKLKDQEIWSLEHLEVLDKPSVDAIFDKALAVNKKETINGTGETFIAEVLPNGTVIANQNVVVVQTPEATTSADGANDTKGEHLVPMKLRRESKHLISMKLLHDPQPREQENAHLCMIWYDLARLCGSCVNGKCVLRYYKLNSDLNDANRNLLAEVILNDYR
ncbi:Argininosuccinate lyase [Frankliniella fusca]|uniref:Argininosuccinate lyase n=1 Tax=Frankliniella fusca TaxID=407009 RepID=A0AAE1HVT2_9NEOP|nr:Argininosuccinate lyase [Frankliniella fusca]